MMKALKHLRGEAEKDATIEPGAEEAQGDIYQCMQTTDTTV